MNRIICWSYNSSLTYRLSFWFSSHRLSFRTVPCAYFRPDRIYCGKPQPIQNIDHSVVTAQLNCLHGAIFFRLFIIKMNFNDKWFNNQKYVTHLPGSEPFLTSRRASSINFLVNIPMANEAKIIQNGNAYVSRIKAMDDNDGDDPNMEVEHHSTTEHTVDDRQNETDDLPSGRKGSEDFTKELTITRGVSDAVVEEKVVKDYFIDDPKGTEVFKVPIRDWRGCSYKPLFKPLALMTEEKVAQRAAVNGPFIPSNAFVAENMEVFSSEYLEKGFLYDPDLLDDPIMLEDTDRFVSENTGPIISSILLYVNENELKDSLNDQFRERHPQLPESLTLTRIRALKKRILTFCISIGYEISTVAYAMVNFERLCLKSRVTKANRKLSMAVSLLLAVKFVEYESLDGQSKKKLDQLFNFFDREWDLDKQEILDAEFGAYVMLGFNLHVPYQHIYLIYTRLLKIANKDNISYLGEDMYEAYRLDILQNEKFRELNRLVVEREREERAAAGIEGENEIGEMYNKHRHDTLPEDERRQQGGQGQGTGGEGGENSEGGGGGAAGGGGGSGGSAVKSAFNRNFFDLMIQIGGPTSSTSPSGRNRFSLGSESELRHTLSTPSTPTSAEMRRSAADLTSLQRSNSTDAQVSKNKGGKRSRSSSKSGKKETFVQKLLNIPAMLRLSSTPQAASSPSPPAFEDDGEEGGAGVRPNLSNTSLTLQQPTSLMGGKYQDYSGVSLGQAFADADDGKQDEEQVGLMDEEEEKDRREEASRNLRSESNDSEVGFPVK